MDSAYPLVVALQVVSDYGWLEHFKHVSHRLFEWALWAVREVRANASALFGLAGFSFGIWRWWYYRESVLHRRLKAYLAEQDRRLYQARSYVLEAIFRPGRKREFARPLFIVRPLRPLLRRRRWDSIWGVGRIEKTADRNLDRALQSIERRLEVAGGQLKSLLSQRSSAHLLKGAIASARAQHAFGSADRADLENEALVQFRLALQVPDHEADAQIKEYEAHQLRRLGHLPEAEIAYGELEVFAAHIPEEKTRQLTLAKAKYYRAQIVQALVYADWEKGNRASPGSGAASILINNQQNGALALRAPFGPFREWDAVEQGDIHYLSAFVYHHLEAVIQEPIQLGLAETAFRNTLNHLPRRSYRRKSRRLREAAQGGLDRVHLAQVKGEYDVRWLLPPSHQSQSPTTTISDGGSN
jgi:hypothetical protein